MILTRSPFRISLGGGGTDLPSYYQEHGGFLVAGAIDKYIGHRKHFTSDDLKKCLQLSGFTPVEVKSAGFPFFNLYRTLVILRGKSLIKDASANNSNILMGFFESLFNLLFKLNNSHFGWQVIGIGIK